MFQDTSFFWLKPIRMIINLIPPFKNGRTPRGAIDFSVLHFSVFPGGVPHFSVHFSILHHSVFKDFTGFTNAALIA